MERPDEHPPLVGTLVLGACITLALVMVTLILWDLHVTSLKDSQSGLPLPPGSFGLPLVGETISFFIQGGKFYKQRQQNFGNVFKTHILGRPTIRIIGPENVRRILKDEQRCLATHWPTSVRKIIGEGSLSMASGQVHKLRRKCVMKAFTYDALQCYMPNIQVVFERYLNCWSTQDVILAYPEIKKMMFSIASETLLGFDLDEMQENRMMTTLEDITNNMFSLPINLPGLGLYKGLKARACLLDQIATHMATTSDNTNSGLYHIQNHAEYERLSPEEVKDIALDLLFTGHETICSAATTLVMYLAKNPTVVLRAYAEIFDMDATCKTSKNSPICYTYQDLNKLKYVNNIVKELLRLMPPIGGGFRIAKQTFEIGGYQIPKGWAINYSIRQTHESSPTFSDSLDSFDPGRWDKVTERDLSQQFEFIPFGGGNRSCAGRAFAKLVLRLFVVELVRRWSFKLLNETTELSMFPIVKPKDNLPMRVRKVQGYRLRSFTVGGGDTLCGMGEFRSKN